MAASVEFDIIAKDRASRTFRNVGQSADVAGNKIGGLGRTAKVGFAAIAAGAVVAGAAAGKFAISSISKASDLNETLSKSRIIFGQNSAAMVKWAAGADRSAGLSKQAALESAASFGDMFTQIGFARNESAKMSRQVVQMSADLGSFNNLPTAEVVDMISASFRGEYDSLQRVIPNINAARVQTQALAMTGKKNAQELTAQEKAAATLAIVQRDGARAAGDFERTSGGLANQQKILSAQFENLQATIGQRLLPVATSLTRWANDEAMPKLRQLADWTQTRVGPAFAQVGAVIQNSVIPAARSFGDWFGNKIAPILADLYQTRIKQVVSAFGSLKGSVRDNEPELRKFGTWLKKGAEIAAQVLGPALKFLGGVQVKALTTGFRVAVTALSAWVDWASTVGNAARRVGGWISDMAGKVVAGGRSFGQLASAAADKINALLDKVRAIPGRITGAIGDLGRLLYGAGAAVIQGLIDGIQSKISSLTSKLSSITKLIPNKKGPLDKDRVLLQPAGVAIMKGLIDGIEKGRKPLELVLEKITGRVKATREKLKNLKQQRADFASGFQFGESIFATPDSEVTSTDAEGNAVTTSVAPTLASMKAFAAAQRAQAAQLNADVKSLVGKGLSVSLIKQMQSQGASGIAQIRALAGGSAADIAEFNALDKETTSLYNDAGMTAASPLFTKPIDDAERDAKRAKELAAEIAAVIKDATRKEMERLEFRLEGRTLVAVLKKEKRENGGKNLGLA